MSRAAAKQRFLEAAGWGGAAVSALAGDASNRRYDRVRDGSRSAVLMDAPPASNGPQTPFLMMTETLRGAGFSAPEVYASDVETGFLLLEDLGDTRFADLLQRDPARERTLYTEAARLVSVVQTLAPPDICPRYDQAVFAREAARFTDHYPHHGDASEAQGLILDAIQPSLATPPTLVLLDVHAENLLWLPEREGLARVGVLDYQDARLGHPAYDLMSLFEDARRDVSRSLRDSLLETYLDETRYEPASFMTDYFALAAQRHLKVLGIFAALTRAGRTGYANHLARVWRLLQEALTHPDLAALADWIAAHVPAPAQIDWTLQ